MIIQFSACIAIVFLHRKKYVLLLVTPQDYFPFLSLKQTVSLSTEGIHNIAK